MLVDTDNAPAVVLGRGQARGLLGAARSETSRSRCCSRRIDAPFVAVPDPHSRAGVAATGSTRRFPMLYRDGAPGYRLVYQNTTWRLVRRAD